jgi:hypothetical protein
MPKSTNCVRGVFNIDLRSVIYFLIVKKIKDNNLQQTAICRIPVFERFNLLITKMFFIFTAVILIVCFYT